MCLIMVGIKFSDKVQMFKKMYKVSIVENKLAAISNILVMMIKTRKNVSLMMVHYQLVKKLKIL